MLCALISIHLSHLMNSNNVVSLLKHLLTTAYIFKVAPAVGWLLPLLLLQTSIVVIFLRNRALLLHGTRSFLRIMETRLRCNWFGSIWLSWYQGHICISSSWTRCLSWISLATIICLERSTSHISRVLRALCYMAKALVITSTLVAILFAHWIGLSLLLQLCQWVLLRFPMS